MFLCLAALYESWSVPFAVILVVPLGVLGALGAANMRMLSNDVYFQVGLLATIGLSAKNAILIVEFAKELHDKGGDLIEATIEASRMRLRPILMTSLAFLLGILPLAISTGAVPAAERHRHGRHGPHVRGDGPRDFLHSGVLRRGDLRVLVPLEVEEAEASPHGQHR